MENAKFIFSKNIVLAQFEKLKELTPLISYSSKTNQDVAKILEENTNTMFSVHFENELKHIKDKSRVVFLAQALNNEQIKRLLDFGINWFIVDNESDVATVKGDVTIMFPLAMVNALEQLQKEGLLKVVHKNGEDEKVITDEMKKNLEG